MKSILQALFLCLGVLLTACTSYSEIREGNSSVLVEDLVEAGDSGEVELTSGLQKLLRLRLTSPDQYGPEKTIETIIALKKLEPASAKQEFIELLKDENEEVRYYSAETLGEIRDSSVIPPLVKATSDEDDLVGEAASKSLTQITMIPIYKEGECSSEEWTQWWEKNKAYFSQEDTK